MGEKRHLIVINKRTLITMIKTGQDRAGAKAEAEAEALAESLSLAPSLAFTIISWLRRSAV